MNKNTYPNIKINKLMYKSNVVRIKKSSLETKDCN